MSCNTYTNMTDSLRFALTICTLSEMARSNVCSGPLLEQLYLVLVDGVESGDEAAARVLARIIINRMEAA
ncbi:hypothetical protein [Chlorobium sp.]|uniref:hypothetical protein n=1 Tax=Chlorobium sp. TaxID=1095 RepID=UPI003C67FF18